MLGEDSNIFEYPLLSKVGAGGVNHRDNLKHMGFNVPSLAHFVLSICQIKYGVTEVWTANVLKGW